MEEQVVKKESRIPHPGWLFVCAITLMALALAMSLWMPYLKEQEAISEITYLGGRFSVVNHSSATEYIYVRNRIPNFLKKILPNDFSSIFDRVTQISLPNQAIGREVIKQCQVMRHLSLLDLSGTQVANDDLSLLKNFTKLEDLALDNTAIDDDGLSHLSQLTSLNLLSLMHNKISDDGAIQLSKLRNLKTLRLDGTRVTKKGVTALKKLIPDCEIIWDHP